MCASQNGCHGLLGYLAAKHVAVEYAQDIEHVALEMMDNALEHQQKKCHAIRTIVQVSSNICNLIYCMFTCIISIFLYSTDLKHGIYGMNGQHAAQLVAKVCDREGEVVVQKVIKIVMEKRCKKRHAI